MSRIIIIGGGGHVGSYLVPTLVTMGHEVVSVAVGFQSPIVPIPLGSKWKA